MKKPLLWSFHVGAAVIGLSLLPAGATEPGPYVKADGGANFITGTELKINGFPGGLSLDTGFRADGIFGYQFNSWLAVEFEGGFMQNSVRSISLQGQTSYPQEHSYFQQVPLLANVVVRYENSTDFIPYLGAGAGGVISRLKIEGNSDDEAAFAFQAKAGLIYKIEETAWLDIGYKLLGTTEQTFGIGGDQLKTKDMLNHFIGASVTWLF